MTPPSECLRHYVLGPWQSYQSDQGSEWKAVCAARAANSHLEWVFRYYKEIDRSRLGGAQEAHEFRKQLCEECPDIAIVNDLADAAGHRFLERRKDTRTIYASTNATYELAAKLYFTPSGRLLFEIIRNVIEFWRRWQD